ncbi:MAG: TonB-dependent receptor [Bacteroidota bacterium]|nr:TonB-dependent receptor [Bacteroidota bacterium]
MKKKHLMMFFHEKDIHEILLKMKLLTFFLFFALVSASANSYSQQAKFNLNMKGANLRSVFQKIEEQSEFIILFNEKTIDINRKVDVNVKNKSIEVLLSQLFEGNKNAYKIYNRQIVILPGKVSTPTERNTLPLQQPQKKKIKGSVKDSKDSPVPGVTILVKGTKNGILTDLDGKFTIDLQDDAETLIFSYVGMKTKEVKIGNQSVINVTLQDDNIGLNEVVAVGYGSQKKVSVIGAVSTVDPRKLISSNANLSSSLAGQLAGILAVQRSGEPGYDQSDFWIRGVSTFNASSQNALVLVDGVERDLNNVDPLDIESFSILKDATATAVYGVRGANGVVLINTKKGKSGKPQIQVQAEYGITSQTQLPKFINGVDYMNLYNEVLRNEGRDPVYSQEDIEKTKTQVDPDLYPNVNWMKTLFNDFSTSQRANMNVSGGTNNIRYFISGSALHEDGILNTSDMEDDKSKLKLSRFNFRSNVDIDLTSTTLFKLNMGGYLLSRNSPSTGVQYLFDQAMRTIPILLPPYYSNGYYSKPTLGGNPWTYLNRSGYSTSSASSIESTISLEQKLDFLLEGLSAKGLFSFDAYNNQTTTLTKVPTAYTATGRDDEGNLIFSDPDPGANDILHLGWDGNSNTRKTYLEAQINYNRTFSNVHNISALFLYNQSDHIIRPAGTVNSSLPYRSNGIAGRLAYNYAYRYFIESNFGYNGSENFAPGKRYGFFPSIALGWMLSEEKPFKNLFGSVVNKLKLKASHGLVGNDKISADRRFGYTSEMTQDAAGYAFGEQGNHVRNGVGVSEYGDETITWEKAKKSNAGIELGLLNLIDLQVDIFKENRENIFMRRQSILATTGLVNNPYANVGKMSNKGLDMSLIINKKINNSLSFSVNTSFTYAANKIEDMDEPEKKYPYQSNVGKRYGQIFGLIAEGLYTKDDFSDLPNRVLKTVDDKGNKIPVPTFSTSVSPGDIKYKDYNKDGVIDDYDNVAIGYANNPEIVYGLGASIQYKCIDFGFLFQGVSRTSVMLGNNGESYFFPFYTGQSAGNIYSNITNRWTEENPRQDVFWPRLSNGRSENNDRSSTWWLRNADFCRLKNIELGCKLGFFKKNVDLMRLYVRGTNVFTWSKDFKHLWDPELVSSNGMQYPTSRVFTIGCEIKF